MKEIKNISLKTNKKYTANSFMTYNFYAHMELKFKKNKINTKKKKETDEVITPPHTDEENNYSEIIITSILLLITMLIKKKIIKQNE